MAKWDVSGMGEQYEWIRYGDTVLLVEVEALDTPSGVNDEAATGQTKGLVSKKKQKKDTHHFSH